MFSRATYEESDIRTCLDVCSKGTELAHKCHYVFGDAVLDFMVGRCQFDCGFYVEGLSHMNDAIKRAMGVVNSEREYEQLVYLIIYLYDCYFVEDDFEEMLRVANLFEPILNDIERKYPDIKTSCNLSIYYQCQYFLHLERAVSLASLGRFAEAEAEFNRCCDMEFASRNGNDRFQIDYYMALGAVDSVLSITQRYPYCYEDTLTWAYQMRIACLERAYRLLGDAATADLYAFRMDNLANIIKQIELNERYGILAAQYNSKHYQLSLTDIEKNINKQHSAVIVLIILGVLSVGVCLLLIIFSSLKLKKDKEEFQQKTSVMEEEVEKLRKQVRLIARRDAKMKAEDGIVEPAALAAFVEENELYLKKDISRALVANLMGCSQRAMTKMLDEIHPGLSFPDYIRSLRIRHALKVISENPNYSVQQLADESGFYSISSFERAFKAVMGKTPKAYLKEKAESSGEEAQEKESRLQTEDGSQPK